MLENSKYGPLVAVVLLGLALQVVLVFADCSNSPHGVAVAFAKAYFRLDPAMADFLCQDSLEQDDGDSVQQYLYTAEQAARNRGFEKSYVKSQLYDVMTHTTYTDDVSAQIEFEALRRKAINPVFAWVAKLFHIGGTYPVETTLQVTKEGGKWKVCGDPFGFH